MSEQRLSQLQRDILTTVQDAPPVQLGHSPEAAYHLQQLSPVEQLMTYVHYLRVGTECFRASISMTDLPEEGVPASYVRLTVARQRNQQRVTIEKDEYGVPRRRERLSSTFHVDFSRSLRNLQAKGWLTLSNRYIQPMVSSWTDGQVFWMMITPAGRGIIKAKSVLQYSFSNKAPASEQVKLRGAEVSNTAPAGKQRANGRLKKSPEEKPLKAKLPEI